MDLFDARGWFDPVSGYLNTAAVGLPPRATVAELDRRITEWREGRCDPASFDPDVARARAAYARIVDTDPGRVAVTGPASVGAGMVAASLPARAVVLCAEEDFTSVLFPFMADERLDVRMAPLDRLLDAVGPDVDLVAVSHVQSADGRVIDLDALASAVEGAGARTYLDLTQSAGWMPIDASRFDVTACHSYKWLCSPRGVGFVTVSGAAAEWLRPVNAGWYAGDDRWASIYGPPLRLAADSRRFDTSPDWFSVAGAVPALELVADLGVDLIHRHDVGLANDFRARLGVEPSNSAIVSVATDRGSRLAEAGIVSAARAGRVRLSFHLYNSVDDVDAVAACFLT
jgi:selenocysteine lyase/cysteine desulfurase